MPVVEKRELLKNSCIPDEEGFRRYQAFPEKYHGRKFAILELGIGFGNRLIKEPLMRLARWEPYAAYITVNKEEVFIADQIKRKSFGIKEDIASVLERLVGE